MKLMSMVAYVDYIWNYAGYTDTEKLLLIAKYANFLKQTLELWMFIPCVGNEPFDYSKHGLKEDFEKAKDRVLFDCGVKIDTSSYRSTKRMLIDLDFKGGFRLFNRHIFHNGDIEEKFLPNFTEIPTIEYLVKYNLTLTESAIKQLGQELEIKQQ